MIPANRIQPPPGSSYAPGADLVARCVAGSGIDMVILQSSGSLYGE
jgi:hypothetical protein